MRQTAEGAVFTAGVVKRGSFDRERVAFEIYTDLRSSRPEMTVRLKLARN